MDIPLKTKWLQEELECTVCFDLAASPIHSCPNGHILCGICFDSLKKCALCKGDMLPCEFAERLVKKYEIKSECKFSESGCTELIRSDQLKAHMVTCEYRSITCFDPSTTECSKKLCSLKEFCQHLKDDHSRPRQTPVSGFLILNFSLDELTIQKVDMLEIRAVYHANYFSYEDYDFIFQNEIQNGTLFWWITILGGRKEACQFKYKTSILHKNTSNKVSNKLHDFCKWQLPVLPIHDNWNFSSALETGKVANIHWKALVPFSVLSKDTNRYSYGMKVQIIRESPAEELEAEVGVTSMFNETNEIVCKGGSTDSKRIFFS